MPMYTYKYKPTGDQLDVLRSFNDYKDIPTAEEAAEAGLDIEDTDPDNWERVIGGTIRVVKGSDWGGGKGNW